jgi:hypothetical protein
MPRLALVSKYHCCVAAMIEDLFGKAIEAARLNGAPHKPDVHRPSRNCLSGVDPGTRYLP